MAAALGRLAHWTGLACILLLTASACRADPAMPVPATPLPAPTLAALSPTSPPPTVALPTAAPTSPPPTSPTALPTRAPSTPVVAASTQAPSTQVLRLSLPSEPVSIDPQVTASTLGVEVILRVFENLLAFDSDGRLVPAAAADLPHVSADGLTYTFTLRPGLAYSDGRPVTARDFEYAWKRHLDPRLAGSYAFAGHVLKGGAAYATANPKSTAAAALDRLRDAVGVRALDDRTLEFTLERPAAYFPSILATWLGVPTREDMVARGGERWTEPPTYIGNGPYILTAWTPGSRLVLTANPRYRLGPPPVARIELAIVAEPAVALRAYRNGELDIIAVDPGEAAAIAADPDLSRQRTPPVSKCTVMLAFNTSKPPFDRSAVRRAFAQAIDRPAYVRTVLRGLALPAHQLVPPDQPGHVRGLQTTAPPPSTARRLLDAEGITDPKTLPEIKLVYPGIPSARVMAEFIQGELQRNLGVTIVLDPVELKLFGAAFASPETVPQLFPFEWCQDYPDPQNWYSTIFHSNANLLNQGWKHPTFDSLTEQADAALDPKARERLYSDAARILYHESPVVFLAHPATSLLVKPSVQGCRPSPFDLAVCSASLMQLRVAPR